MPDLKSLVFVEQWRKNEAAHLFATKSSFEWFYRQHRSRLIESGAILPRPGRAGNLGNRDVISTEIVSILAEQVQKRDEVQ